MEIGSKPVSQWKCEDFLVIDDNFYPTAIGAAEIVTQKGKVEDPTLNISGIETVTPLIVDACKKAPKESFIQKVEEYLKKWWGKKCWGNQTVRAYLNRR
ncbi:acid-activated periplasmic chaperone HdeA [Providencia stuartii]|nr:acid-activated periplasmic chaperone HdeA [Providencia stuartii]